ncbi:thiamine biosynthesis protein ThiI [Bacillus manliponensis]|uniref:Probable tRNA sulfurtransferase n=1 Tax=Bacillus manliponensis TaxID=574376 RepID=A0A073JV35_9BACI|nr:tRNA uracil 4-sulfurtransferase ThiI [Bacillus manliponensis]KEK18899.1 thiamine biosynthesis protein ThiI [Bacillus manliponensis]
MMNYEYILVRYGEMTTKGKNRSKFVSTLKDNVKHKLKKFKNIKVEATHDRMYIQLNGEDHEAIAEHLQDVFGIHKFNLAMKVPTDLEEIKKGALAAFLQLKHEVKTFKITVHRSYKHFPMQTMEILPEIGGYVLQNTEDITVDVHNPDVNIRVEIRSGYSYIMCDERMGAGGLPVGVGGKVMLLLSGGIDSPVAAYLTMKRGVSVEAVHFHSPPFTSERAKQKVIDLAQELTKYCKRVTLHLVPFTEVQKTIHKEVPSSYSMTVMRRMMMRIAERIAEERNALALTTGESLGQVASQTLDSMHTINEVTNYPVIRPLIAMDKLEIIKIAHEIGTYETSIRPYEDCCTVFTPASPATKPKREKANKFESYYDFTPLIEEAVANTEKMVLQTVEVAEEEQFEDLF